MREAFGYAVVASGEIMVPTVSVDRLGARVNGLVLLFGVIASRDDTELEIARRWEYATSTFPERVQIKRVEIRIAGAEGDT
jgi:hypothetical protein